METALVEQPESVAALTPLNSQEQADLAACEAAIGKGLTSFVEVGRALLAIRDGRLYRADHRTFEEYCRTRWQMGRAHANRYIDGSAVAGILAPIGDIPGTESQARPLTRIRTAAGELDDKTIIKVWGKIVANASTMPDGRKQVTARIVESEVIPLVRRRRDRNRRVQAIADGFPSGTRVDKRAFKPIRGLAKHIPMLTLSLPLCNPRATVASFVSHFDRPYIEAVVAGLQRYLEDGYVEPAVPLPTEGTTIMVTNGGGEA